MTTLPITPDGHRSVYTGRSTSWPMVIGTSSGAILLIAMSGASGEDRSGVAIAVALTAVGVILNVLTSSSVRATAGPNGFTVHWGVVGWPRCTYHLDEIASVDVIDLSWWRVSWGFWWTPRRTCCTVRSGPTVRLTLRNGRIVTVSVPDPESAVEAIDRALAERSS